MQSEQENCPNCGKQIRTSSRRGIDWACIGCRRAIHFSCITLSEEGACVACQNQHHLQFLENFATFDLSANFSGGPEGSERSILRTFSRASEIMPGAEDDPLAAAAQQQPIPAQPPENAQLANPESGEPTDPQSVIRRQELQIELQQRE
ncbi:MAG: hypothetical protein GY822_32290, partial [Deltaproteobacteria bacterium]|nr:hypothetical protein [Deltaproteobacteria bacterium]